MVSLSLAAQNPGMKLLARLWRIALTRPRLWWSLVCGALVYALLPQAMARHAETRALLAWNATALLYLALAWHMIHSSDAELMRRRALAQTEGRMLVLALVVGASLAVVVAIGSQLATVRDLHGLAKSAHVSLAGLTLVTSWLFTQVLFALNYAHDFYVARNAGRPDPMDFPGTREPGYADFFYFACAIGTSGQAADVAFSSSELRPVGTLHCILAFFFNTTVLALTINIAAGLF
jgi:uncharacterized membrane protein